MKEAHRVMTTPVEESDDHINPNENQQYKPEPTVQSEAEIISRPQTISRTVSGRCIRVFTQEYII